MCWVNDKIASEIFEYSYSFIKTKVDKESLKKRFLEVFLSPSMSNTEKIVHSIRQFPDDLDNKAREACFEICLKKNFLNKTELSKFYLSLHTHARPYRHFSKEKLYQIFDSIDIPILDFESVKVFDALEDELTIYRGIRGDEVDMKNIGYCWSLDEQIATEMFGTGDGKVNGFVIVGKISKRDIIGYILTRDEKEIIAKPEMVEFVRIKRINANY